MLEGSMKADILTKSCLVKKIRKQLLLIRFSVHNNRGCFP